MEKVNCRKMVCESRITGGFCMKNMKAILSILLAVVLLVGSVPVVVFAPSESVRLPGRTFWRTAI